jgi:hypothetical protein
MESETLNSIPETWGLLDQEDHDADGPAPDDAETPKVSGLIQRTRKRIQAYTASRTARITAAVFLTYFLLEFGLLTLQVPGSRLFERAVCRRYYRDISSPSTFLIIAEEIEERLCKIAPIQREVALLVGWRDSFLAIPSELPLCFGCLDNWRC